MANRRSDSRRTPAPAQSASAAETTQPAESARKSGSTSRQGSAPREPSAARSPIAVPAETRRAMIAEAAYLRAERRGFVAGREEEDWLAAEEEVDALLSAGQGGGPQ